MLTKPMLSLLGCPSCRAASLDFHPDDPSVEALTKGSLVCGSCQATFPVCDGVPDLIPHNQLATEEWKLWEGHLDGYSDRQDFREKKPSRTQSKRWEKKQNAFLDFVDVPEGPLLDIGCGPAGIREGLDLERTTYIGIDPIPTRAIQNVPFARAIAEYMPFRDDAFSCLVARSALDHFCDLRGFFKESARVLRPNGVMFIEQAIHGEGGLKGAIKSLVHETKDFLDDRKMPPADRNAPKHMTDFTQTHLLEATNEFFTVTALKEYSPNLLAATQLFVALRRKH